MKPQGNTIWDVAVIGGGPAGMLAAGRAAELGKKVIIIEKNKTFGNKLLLTGGGRCNLTNAEFDNRKLLLKFKENSKFLFSPFSQFSVQETINFFNSRGVETKIEEEGRVFPITDNAYTILNSLIAYMKEGEVTIVTNSEVMEFKKKDNLIDYVQLKNGDKIHAKNFILATGGKSHPETGSTGDGFRWLKKIGHTVIEPDVSLVPITVKDSWVKKLSGVSLSDVKLTLFQDDVKKENKEGKILFTHMGMSGPAVLNLSKEIGQLLKTGSVIISLDVLPSLNIEKLDAKLQEIFKENSNKKIKNSLSSIIAASFVGAVIKMAGINPETFCHSITRDERIKLGKTLKDMRMKVKGLLGVDKAIITSGGVKSEEIDFKTMRSKISPNLYLVGDILNIDRPSGGYSLQLCWTTGYVAGNSIGKE